MGGAKRMMMEHEDDLNRATAYLVDKDVLKRCPIHDEVYSDGPWEIDPDFWPIAMADRNRGDNGPAPWAADMKARDYTDLLKEAYEGHAGDECGYCAKNAAE